MTLSVNIFDTSSNQDDVQNQMTSMRTVCFKFTLNAIIIIIIIIIINIINFIKTIEEFNREESQHLYRPPFYFNKSELALYCHDATWTLAWSLDKTIRESTRKKSTMFIFYIHMNGEKK